MGEEKNHGHHHSAEGTRAISNRLARAIGHLEVVRRMVTEERDCAEVLTQLAAVRSALNSVSRMILKEHIESCLVEAAESGDQSAMEELDRAIERLLK